MNDSGQIVGVAKVAVVVHPSSPPHVVYHPVLWQNGVLLDLGVLAHIPCTDVATPMDCSSGSAIDINAHGVVLGRSTGPGGIGRAFVWENGVMRDLGVYPGRWVSPLAINDRGQILAVVDDSAFLWEGGHTQTIIRTVDAFPQALGPNGEVIGRMTAGPGNLQHAWVWQAGRLTDLGTGIPIAINSRGDIIGNWYGDNGGSVAILWRKKRGR
jgi:probable HAF family extracellular repeat protein